MPIRISKRGAITLTYNEQDRTWMPLTGISFQVLNQHIEIEPGVTFGEFLYMLSESPDVAILFENMHGVSFGEIFRDKGHRPPLLPFEPVWIEIRPDWRCRTDKRSGGVKLKSELDLWLCNEGLSCFLASAFRIDRDHSCHFSDIKHLELRLCKETFIENEDISNSDDFDDEAEVDESCVLTAMIDITLLDVINCVGKDLCGRGLDTRYQHEVDWSEEMDERANEAIRGRHADSDDNEDDDGSE